MIRSLASAALLSLAALPSAAGTAPAAAPAARAPAPAPAATPPAAAAPAAELPLDEIVKRASAQWERKPKKLACTVVIDAAQLESDGKPKETQGSELVETWTDGVSEEGLASKRSIDGKPFTPEEMKRANEQDAEKRKEMKEHEEKGEGGNVDPPLAATQLARHKFALVRREQQGGRDVYLLSVAPASSTPDEHAVTREGTLAIDAQSFVLLHAETHAAPLPKHVEKMEFVEEYQATAQGETAPKSLLLSVKGGILFLTRSFRVQTTWRDCK